MGDSGFMTVRAQDLHDDIVHIVAENQNPTSPEFCANPCLPYPI